MWNVKNGFTTSVSSIDVIMNIIRNSKVVFLACAIDVYRSLTLCLYEFLLVLSHSINLILVKLTPTLYFGQNNKNVLDKLL